MSREILVISGAPDEASRRRRSHLVAHAARKVPGFATVASHETSNAIVAVVRTEPDNGSVSVLDLKRDGVFAAVAVNPTGLIAASHPPETAAHAGAEAGHTAVRAFHDGSLVLSTDGIASVPSYWTQPDNDLFFSTHLASLLSLGVPARIDDQALLEYLVMLHPLEDHTLLQGVRTLPPGCVVRWKPDGHTDVRSRPLFMPRSDAMSDSDAVATFGEVWKDVIGDMFARNGGQRLALGLSGGLDSRSVAAASTIAGERPLTFSYGTKSIRDSRSAASVADRLQLPHLHIPVTDNHLMPRASQTLERLDGTHSPAEMYELWFDDILRTFADVVINGAAGGPLWGDEKAIGLKTASDVSASVWARYSGAASAITPFLSQGAKDDIQHVVRAGIDNSLAPWDFGARGDMAVFWRIANRQVRWGNTLLSSLRRVGLRSEMPYLDSRLLYFASRLTADQRRNGTLHLRVHRELFNQTAGIERADDGNSPANLNHVYWSSDRSYIYQLGKLAARHPVSGARRSLRRATQVSLYTLRGRTPLHHFADRWDESASVFPIDVWARSRAVFRLRLASLLESAVGSHGLISDAFLAKAADDLRVGARVSGSAPALAKVAAAGTWLNDFAARAADAKKVMDRL